MTEPASPAPVPTAVALYLALLQFLLALCWIVYVIYLPQLAAQVGIGRGTVVLILLADQTIFTVTDFLMGVAADRMKRLVGRLSRVVAAMTALSCLSFLLLPWLTTLGEAGLVPFVGLTVIWTATSSALRAPPLTLLGKYAAKPALPWLSSLVLLGLGISSAVAPYVAMTLRDVDPRIPFLLSSVALVLATLALGGIERRMAGQAPAVPAPPAPSRPVATPMIVFTLAVLVFAIGFQLHFAINSAPLFRRFAAAADIAWLMPLFWVGFNLAMAPASLITKRLGGVPVMGAAGLLGALAVLATVIAQSLNMMIVAQLVAGAAWGCILMSAFAAALVIGETAQGKAMGLLFSALAIATLARIGVVAGGLLRDPGLTAALQWLPTICWAAAGAMLILLALGRMRQWAAA